MKSKPKKTALQAHIERLIEATGGVRRAAKAFGVDPGYLCRLRDGTRANPSPDMLRKLGLTMEVKYHEAHE